MTYRILVEGPLACFTRPDFRVERRSYDAITHSAALGILNAVFGKHEIRWGIKSIEVINPIVFTSFTTGETKTIGRVIDPTLRTNHVLRDVAYVIEADYRIVQSKHNRASYDAQITRQMTRGGCYHQPHFGLREMIADYRLLEPGERIESRLSERDRNRELGMMLKDMIWEDENHRSYSTPIPVFKPASLDNGFLVYGEL